MTNEQVLDAAFPWPGKIAAYSTEEQAAAQWVARARTNYRNRIALLEKIGAL
jgi:hypothetical protein